MKYEKIGFEPFEVLKAEHLNHIEAGIEQIDENLENIEDIISEYKIAENTDILKLFKKRSETND